MEGKGEGEESECGIQKKNSYFFRKIFACEKCDTSVGITVCRSWKKKNETWEENFPFLWSLSGVWYFST
jgi:hypothetical protein